MPLVCIVPISLIAAEGWTWLSCSAILLIPLGIAGFVDAMTCRIELREHSLVVIQNLRCKEYPRALLVKASWAKGCPAALQMTSGHWLSLPDVGSSSESVVNTLRAWMKC
jgi:hypothetical protein